MIRNNKKLFVVFLAVLLLNSVYGLDAREDKKKELKPIELEDILAWKNIQSSTLSNDTSGSPTDYLPMKGTVMSSLKKQRGIQPTSFQGVNHPAVESHSPTIPNGPLLRYTRIKKKRKN